ncbi:nitroreductase/quinone reductase family protein [Nocardia sp. BSTN01]|uniref:nitroreductase/quinone reductase family protein n=1 Tax=Nocardia sp. BSTN01 TaxID=2783665 RepID=UPI002814D0A0|nr:nitroreductase/quinone reductase family protein [Nocardia sp. BSTN01]
MPDTRRIATDLRLKTVTGLHRTLLDVTGGRIGTRFKKMPTLTLTTVGRRSGRRHTVVLTVPIVDGERYLIVASRGGDAVSPAWYHNLCAEPRVEVSFRHGAARSMTARVLTPAEREVRWPQVVRAYPGYADYQKRTARRIPLIELSPPGG